MLLKAGYRRRWCRYRRWVITPSQQKIAVIELDKNEKQKLQATLYRLKEAGGLEPVIKQMPCRMGQLFAVPLPPFRFFFDKKTGNVRG
jgi:hypothetical protein